MRHGIPGVRHVRLAPGMGAADPAGLPSVWQACFVGMRPVSVAYGRSTETPPAECDKPMNLKRDSERKARSAAE